jgi:hypothetical protein
LSKTRYRADHRTNQQPANQGHPAPGIIKSKQMMNKGSLEDYSNTRYTGVDRQCYGGKKA